MSKRCKDSIVPRNVKKIVVHLLVSKVKTDEESQLSTFSIRFGARLDYFSLIQYSNEWER
jgi:hypothetical protein